MRTPEQLRDDLFAIWNAGVAAVKAERLIQDHVRVAGERLEIADESIDLSRVGRIAVVGAGKAGAGMAAGLETALGDGLMRRKRLSGWINVPDDCVRSLSRIYLHGGRPAGVNEPTGAGAIGAEEILKLAGSLGDSDLCIVLLSGGASALLPAPIAGITLEDKQAVTRYLSAAGANIAELNTVRKQLSRIKGGGLARHCTAGRMIALVISDVLGDPLDLIGSGPTVVDSGTPQAALAVLEKHQARGEIPASVFEVLERSARLATPAAKLFRCRVQNFVIGNNALAVDAAGIEAERRGYSHAMHASTSLEGPAEEIGRHLADMALSMRDEAGPDCLITGGEPTVQLADPAIRGKGGRNQQLVLAALERLLSRGESSQRGPISGIALLSGGTDGEDGPTDAAGAWIDATIVAAMQQANLSPGEFLRRTDAYHFFESLGGLIKTGPTHTNVCDLRVVVVDRRT
jgi:hydroxypyruvate reductase